MGSRVVHVTPAAAANTAMQAPKAVPKVVAAIANLGETEEIKLNHPVILMHNPLKGTPSTVAALPTIIEFFKAHGYTFVAL